MLTAAHLVTRVGDAVSAASGSACAGARAHTIVMYIYKESSERVSHPPPAVFFCLFTKKKCLRCPSLECAVCLRCPKGGGERGLVGLLSPRPPLFTRFTRFEELITAISPRPAESSMRMHAQACIQVGKVAAAPQGCW